MKCCVKSCNNIGKVTKSIQENRLTYHTFPKDPIIRTAWVEALGVSDWEPTDKTMICSEHFREEDIQETMNGARRINNGAIPSLKLEDLDAPATMRACKICLSLDKNMYHLRECKLYDIYENITGIPQFCDDEARLPQCVCWDCAAQLTAAASFKTKALFSYNLLADLLKTETNIKIRDIKFINREHINLNSTLQKQFDSIQHDEQNQYNPINCEQNDIPHTEDIETDKKPLDMNEVIIKQEVNDEILVESLQHYDHEAVKTEVDLVQNNITTQDRNDKFKESVSGDGNDNMSSNEADEKRTEFTEIQIKIENYDTDVSETMGDETSMSSSQVYTEVKETDDQIMDDDDDDDDDMVLSEVCNKKRKVCKVIKSERVGEKEAAVAEATHNTEDQDTPGSTRKKIRLDESTKHRIIFLKQQGWPVSSISRELHVSRRSVNLWWRRWNDEGVIDNHVTNGRPRKTTAEEDQKLLDRVNEEKSAISPAMAVEFGLSQTTFRRRLIEGGIRKEKPIKPPPKEVVSTASRWNNNSMYRIDESTKHRIIAMRQEGKPVSYISRELGVTRNTVYTWWQRWCDEGTLNYHKTNGRPRKTTAEQDQYLLHRISDEKAHPLMLAEDLGISRVTMGRRLREAGFLDKKRKPGTLLGHTVE